MNSTLIDTAYTGSLIVEGFLCKKTSNSALFSYVKRYFVLNLINFTFSYRKNRESKQERFGIGVNTIECVKEVTNDLFKSPGEFKKNFIVTSKKRQLILFSKEVDYVQWINGFAACLSIKVRPALTEPKLFRTNKLNESPSTKFDHPPKVMPNAMINRRAQIIENNKLDQDLSTPIKKLEDEPQNTNKISIQTQNIIQPPVSVSFQISGNITQNICNSKSYQRKMNKNVLIGDNPDNLTSVNENDCKIPSPSIPKVAIKVSKESSLVSSVAPSQRNPIESPRIEKVVSKEPQAVKQIINLENNPGICPQAPKIKKALIPQIVASSSEVKKAVFVRKFKVKKLDQTNVNQEPKQNNFSLTTNISTALPKFIDNDSPKLNVVEEQNLSKVSLRMDQKVNNSCIPSIRFNKTCTLESQKSSIGDISCLGSELFEDADNNCTSPSATLPKPRFTRHNHLSLIKRPNLNTSSILQMTENSKNENIFDEKWDD